MKTIYHNKLVRDKIPQIIAESGALYEVNKLNETEYLNALKSKLVEEVQEYLESESIEELADILEVIKCLQKTHNISEGEMKQIQKTKAELRGSFEDRINLVKVTRQRED
ncbi:nucleoside triphosphate pyrophosphohydrolase [Fusibacter sp. 3D3]|uniref:nucleoside triphosphate pyrophosphohydrolase n=1 Tax=Fusibacter sp. 3D3 TaxID=1048380 RepID=UPI000853A157|nr:nucleoside triphosphate pyrophosphohydrolase [Fusibacter sp. 3D3]GAU76051.1 hypothetical protein F3D3_0647 [Fusibacter sp. 3D3]